MIFTYNIYIDISIHVIDIHLMAEKKTTREFVTQYDI